MKYRRSNSDIEVRQVRFANTDEIAAMLKWCDGKIVPYSDDGPTVQSIQFKRDTGRTQIATDGDWIVKDAFGACDTIEWDMIKHQYVQIV